MPIHERDQRPTAAGHQDGEWTFKKGGQVFGPVSARELVALLYRGELDGRTPVAGDDGAYRPLGQVPAFLVQVKKAEAQLRVEREVTGARLLKRRRRRLRWTAAALLVLGGGGGGLWLAWWLAASKPWEPRSRLLEDFGGGIAIASPVRIGGGRRAEAQAEVEIPAEAGRRAARSAQAPSGSAEGGELVAAQYDVSHIQALVGREQRTLAPCFREEARRSPDFAGEIPIEFAIGNDGRVVQLWIDQPRFKRGELHECLLRTLRGWAFRPFPGQRPTVSLSFRVGPS
ncbi:MAG TPA: AgmX/PglI C-terminal domain-containing protein [Anaeromyxobacteraceae bacterium]|nr:AgmX/PglI C-terminal domain-containing protein [Anaeromyxobacteraceae bacterium]